MNAEFSRTLSLLRQEKGWSASAPPPGVLGISQALLSHYENGIREPGLTFVVKACDYYGVSADYLLGRTLTRDGTTIGTEELYDISDEKDNSMRGSVLALLSKKLLVNSVGMLFDLLGKTGSREAIRAASNYLSTALYKVYRHLYHAQPGRTTRTSSSVSQRHFMAGLADADMHLSEGGALRRPGRPRPKPRGRCPRWTTPPWPGTTPSCISPCSSSSTTPGSGSTRALPPGRGRGKK